MNKDERKKYVELKSNEREEIQNKIQKIEQQRSQFITEKLKDEGQNNTLDAAMLKIIREQAGKKNYKFE